MGSVQLYKFILKGVGEYTNYYILKKTFIDTSLWDVGYF